MQPSPEEVAATVDRILSSPWPATLEDALPWLEALGIQTQTAQESSRDAASVDQDSRSWHRAEMTGWPGALAGWAGYRGAFADVNWFLWEDHDWEEVERAATELAGAISATHGAPVETTAATQSHGSSWWWQLERHGIDMYAHNGRIRPDGFPPGPSVVQFHIDLRAVAEPREAEARRRAGVHIEGDTV